MTRPLRICLVASSRFPVREPFMGGLEAHTHALASALVRHGHEVSLFAAPGSDPHLGAHELRVRPFRASAAARADVGSSPETAMAAHHAYLGLMLDLTRGTHGEFDIVHNNSLHHLPVAMSNLLRTPVVTTLHTPPLDWLESAAELAAPTARFVGVSEYVVRAWGHVVNAEVIQNGVDLDRWVPGPGGSRAVWTGRLVPEKGARDAIMATRAAGMALDLAGPVHDRGYFETEVRPLLGADARYLGHLDERELCDLVGHAAVALVSSRWQEPFGLVAAEALACGTPVAAYDVGGLGEVVDPSCGRLAQGGDVVALAAAVEGAAGLDRAAARRRAEDCFGIERMVEDYERLYRGTVAA